MKLSLGLAAALAGCAAAATGAQQSAQVYLIPGSKSTSSKSTPVAVSPSLARLIFLQRLSPFGKGPSIRERPSRLEMEEVVSALNTFGKSSPALFSDEEASDPNQLVVILEDMTASQMSDLEKQVKNTYKGMKPAFSITNPPSARAHEDLVNLDFFNAGITNEHACDLDLISDTKNGQCWSGKATVGRYNADKVCWRSQLHAAWG